ncbi:MAG: hypothetical protein QM734_17450 [Cyclobacteriaceae bacterium]
MKIAMLSGLILIVLSVPLHSLTAQSRPQSIERNNYDCWVKIDHSINRRTDSLNFWKSGKLPKFIYEPLLDHLSIPWGSDCFLRTQFISHRKAILDRVINEEVLNAIILSPDKRLDELYLPQELSKKITPAFDAPGFPDLPYMRFSTRQLAEKRLNTLREKKREFGLE